jgi:predicted transposase YbfD/YdcC
VQLNEGDLCFFCSWESFPFLKGKRMTGSNATVTAAGFLDAFSSLSDPRSRKCAYPLDELLLVALCAITSGAETWVEVVDWGEHKLEWLRKFLPFAQGIASHDTFSRVFCLLSARQFEACFVGWMSQLCPALKGQAIAIDGKSVRRSHGRGQSMVHLVSAWHSAAGLTLGQVKTADKSNEIKAIPELLDALDIQGATITLDAMGCQRAIVQQIIDKGADYVIAVKDNQPTLSQALQEWFAEIEAGRLSDVVVEAHTEHDASHGREQIRQCVATADVAWLKDIGQDWAGLKSAVCVRSQRKINGDPAPAQVQYRYYISSLAPQAALLSQIVRGHWGIENSLHWVLDVAFGEDDCRIRTGDGAQNFAILRRMALNLLKHERSTKVGVHAKRLRAGWNCDYLQTLLGLKAQKNQ